MAGPSLRSGGWSQPHRWVIVVVLVVLVLTGLATYGFAAASDSAVAKAETFSSELEAAGLRAPSDPETVAKVLGNDGGVACDDPGGALRKALLDAGITNGAAFVGQRPVRGARNLVQGELILLEVYCPDVADEFRAKVEDYTFDDVVKE